MMKHQKTFVKSSCLALILIIGLAFDSPIISLQSYGQDTSQVSSLYLDDLGDDSTNQTLAPWAEIISISSEYDAITIKAKQVINSSTTDTRGLEQYCYMLFFDENFDNKTEVILRYPWTSNTGYIFRPYNRTYYHNGSWNTTVQFYDEKVEENATTGETTLHVGEAMKGEVRVKVVSYYLYDLRYGAAKPFKVGGDTVPNCGWAVSDVVAPANYQDPLKGVNDTRFPYPDRSVTFTVRTSPDDNALPTDDNSKQSVLEITLAYLEQFPVWVRDNIITASLMFLALTAIIVSLLNKVYKSKPPRPQP